MKQALLVAASVLVLAAGMVAGARDALAGGGCHDEVMSDATGVAVDLKGSCFWPTVVRVQAGGTVTWTNRDAGILHTVTGVAQSWGTYDEVAQGESVAYQFDNSGVFPYFCLLHPSMIGAVVVGDGSASAAAAGAGAKLVSAIAPVAANDADQSALESPADSEDASGGVPLTLVAGAVLAAGLIGTSAGVVIGRRAKNGAA